jgi:trimeric autotransporter adhesin
MATYVNDLRLKEITTGDESGTWGTSTNTNLELIAEAFSYGTEVITTNADTHTTTIDDGATDPGRSLYLKYTGTLDSACTITIGPNTVSKVWIIENGTSGSQNIIISQGSGATITIPAGDTKVVYSDGAGAGAAFFDAFASLNVGALNVDGAVNFAADVTFADGADIITASAGTSNFRAGVNAGNSIVSGGNYNTVVGDEAGTAITTGDYNTTIGFSAGTALTTGEQNVIIGPLAGDALTDADFNVAVGLAALSADTLGSRSTAIGHGALENQNFTSATDTYNTAVGYVAGLSITTGVQNTFIGGLAGTSITEANQNVAVGHGTLDADTLGARNVAVGTNALTTQNFTSATNSYNVGLGYFAGANITTGVQNTFLGSLAGDANTTASNNTAVGYTALGANTTGTSNVALGHESLASNTTASFNTALGKSALENNTTGANNTAVGYTALLANTEGTNLTAVGWSALASATTTGYSVAVGSYALRDTTTGRNVGIGSFAGYQTNTGTENTFIGDSTAADNTTGSNNVALGYSALNKNTTASNNTAVGKDALFANTTGAANTAIGSGAAGANLTGQTSVFIGFNAGNSTVLQTAGIGNVLVGPYTHGTDATANDQHAFGYNLAAEAGYTTLGDTGNDIRAAFGVATWATVSDERYKKDITDSTTGLSFINALQPRTFKYKTLGELPETFRAYEADSTEVFKNSNTNHGFIAQEVKAAIDADDSIKDGFKLWDDREDGSQEVAEAALIPVLVKAIQELSAQNDALTTRITALEG